MSMSNFDAFKSELVTIKDIIAGLKHRTIRDEDLKARIQELFRTWTSVVRPSIETLIIDKKQLLKFSAEVEALAKLTSKYKSTADYQKHLKKSIELANGICIYLPPSGSKEPPMRVIDTFIKGIPDLPSNMIPNSLLGWKSNIESFVDKYPFDKSVFIMIRYRKRNEDIIKSIKDILKKHNLYGVLASDHKLTDDLYNPVACLFCCSKGIVVFDQAEAYQTFNPNVAYELGMMHLLGRNCLILKYRSIKTLHSDILMKLYQPYKTLKQIKDCVNNWLDGSQTIG